jgi:hypothetical protein
MNPGMRFTVTRCPNNLEVRDALSRAMPAGYQQRRRGRGHRFARWPGDARYHQSLPLELAGWFTLYGQPGHPAAGWLPITLRLRFVRLEGDGRPRLRVLT